jgi:hypothetical protein
MGEAGACAMLLLAIMNNKTTHARLEHRLIIS